MKKRATRWNSSIPVTPQKPRKQKPIAKSTKPIRKSKVKRVNRERAAAKFARNFHSKEFVEMVKFEGRCASCGYEPIYEAQCSHAEPRGMGGCGAGWWRIFRQCSGCHGSYQKGAARFLRARGLTMDDVERWISNLQREAHEQGILSDDDMRFAREKNQPSLIDSAEGAS